MPLAALLLVCPVAKSKQNRQLRRLTFYNLQYINKVLLFLRVVAGLSSRLAKHLYLGVTISLAKRKQPSGKTSQATVLVFNTECFTLGIAQRSRHQSPLISIQVATPQPSFPKQVVRTISAGLFIVVMLHDIEPIVYASGSSIVLIT